MPGSIKPAHGKSEPTMNSVLDLFQVPPTDISFSAYRMVPIQTYTTGINPIEFQIDAQEGYIDLSRSYLEIELGFRKANGDNLAAAEKLWPVNNLAHSLFRQINVRLDGALLNDNLNHYHYKAYLETLLNYNRADGETVLVPQGWFNQIDVKEEYTDNNTNLEAQAGAGHNDWQALSQNHKDALATQKAELDHYAGGKRRFLRFKPLLEAFQLSKVLVPGVQMNIQFYLNPPSIFMDGVGLAVRMVPEDIKMRFYLCQLRLNDRVYRGLTTQIATKHKIATYPVVRSEVRSFPLQAGLQRKEITNPFQSRVPNRMIVGMVDSRAFNGDYTRDPFCFQKFGLISIRQLLEGEEIPYETLQLNRNNADRDLTGYHRFLQASGALCKHEGNMVRSKDWGAGKNCTLFMFDNVATGCVDTSYLNPKQVGEVQIELLLGEALEFNVNVVVYAEFENLLEIDANKAVI